MSIKYTRYSYQHLDHDILIGRYSYLCVLSSISEKNPAGGTSGKHYEQQKLFLDGLVFFSNSALVSFRFAHVGLDLAPEFGKGKSHVIAQVVLRHNVVLFRHYVLDSDTPLNLSDGCLCLSVLADRTILFLNRRSSRIGYVR